MQKISVPLQVPVSANTNFNLNLNVYRNAHFQTLNKAKIAFKWCIQEKLSNLTKQECIKLTYVLYPKTKRLCDVSNVCSVVDKFFSDALTECQVIEDDNYTFIPEVCYKFGAVDSANPRVDVFIESIKEKDMQLNVQFSLDEQDIQNAIKAYIVDKIPVHNLDKVTFFDMPKTIKGLIPSDQELPHADLSGPAKYMAKDTKSTEESAPASEPVKNVDVDTKSTVESAPWEDPVAEEAPKKTLFGNLRRPE